MEFSYLQVLILFSLYHITEILQVLQKSGGEYYDLLYLKCDIKSHMLYLYHAIENIANQNSGIQCILLMVLCPLLLVCVVILFLPKSST